MIIYDEELIDTEDIFENEEVVLMKSTFKSKFFSIQKLAVGVKNENGDIVKIIDVSEKIL